MGPQDPNSGLTLQSSNSGPKTPTQVYGYKDGWTDGCMEIHRCILQFFSPLGPLPCFNSAAVTKYTKQGKGIADHVKSLDYWFSFYSLMGYKLKKMGG